jgi:Uma2 family endonuclease
VYDGDLEDLSMSAPTLAPPSSILPGESAFVGRCSVIIDDNVCVPSWIVDLDTYRQWAHSAQYPERGSISFLDGQIWVDLSMEELITHNKVKTAFSFEIMKVLRGAESGEFIGDRMFLTNTQAKLATEPDGLAYVWSTMISEKLIAKAGKSHGFMELQGTPDLVLEVVSKSSVQKDTVHLRDSYWKAGIPEYWLANALGEAPIFEILHRNDDGYAALEATQDWQTSRILKHQFRLVSKVNPIGHLQYFVESRPLS